MATSESPQNSDAQHHGLPQEIGAVASLLPFGLNDSPCTTMKELIR